MKNPFSLEARVWSAGILNIVFVLFQIQQILKAQSSAGVSVISVVGFLYVQITFAQLGMRTKDRGLMWGMAVTAVLSVIQLLLIYRYR